MPIYPYECQECGNQFEVLSRTFEVKEATCPQCHSPNTKRVWGSFYATSGKIPEPPTDYIAAEIAIKRHLDKQRPDLAAKEAEKAGRKKWEVERIRAGKYSPKIIE